MFVQVSVFVIFIGIVNSETSRMLHLPKVDAVTPPANKGKLIRVVQGESLSPKVYYYNPEVLEVTNEQKTETQISDGNFGIRIPEKQSNLIFENKEEKGKIEEQPDGVRVYYIYHPSGYLQKVEYSTSDNPMQMAFRARLRYTNVEPIKGPIYTYDPKTYVFRTI